ncbi:AAA family ATPase [Riemerella anatipestifer]|uniref:AAA family ATPase n=1 Tax=Riemerella anatipestifer TaxID=34085 RepID=UPI0012AD3893|nr:AAA family ATPase [Riemerella anatipestifer]USL94699.1 AAA family ATPase [Riemerella anatipestifer]
MKIDKVILENFRVYSGLNKIKFNDNPSKNITLISGKNGYGKTTFLTSLIWCFYGKMMVEVEEKYRNDIKNLGGYEKFLETLYSKTSNNLINPVLSVEIVLNDVLIPSIPCKTLSIKRTFDIISKLENLEVLIDGFENELTKQVGFDVFINDFVLPREIAKFFFFDAEKIVSLAEAKTKNELKSLSRAYSEVLGIKKYEDLRKNLQSIISRFKRNGANALERTKLDDFIKKEQEYRELIEINENKQKLIDNEINSLRQQSELLQEKLIREGNKITLNELMEIKEQRDLLKEDSIRIKNKLKNFLEVIPFIIAGKKFEDLKNQIDLEKNSKLTNQKVLIEELKDFADKIKHNINTLVKDEKLRFDLLSSINNEVFKSRNIKKKSPSNILLDLDESSINIFDSLYSRIKNSFSEQFQSIVQEEKNNRVLLNKTLYKIKAAESKTDNPVTLQVREDKLVIDNKIFKLIRDKEILIEELGGLRSKYTSTEKILSELEKQFKVRETDLKKFEITTNLLQKISTLITKIKDEKKYSLQKSILLEFNKIMHKEDFIKNVRVNVHDEYMDIDLLDKEGFVIDKNLLSKGEQQLYATALLKALVVESGINFPVFIDSPLQKFDKNHSLNIIKEFYPTISDQVVLFPLLEKELTFNEFELMKDNISKVYLIENFDKKSKFKEVKKIDDLFNSKNLENVYSN